MLLDVGRAVSIYSEIIPHGLVVFFSSYAAKRQLVDLWGKSGILFDSKRVFEEGEDLDISSYHQAAKTENGAILFAVMHGRLSEGINFSDESGRGVLVIGVPYPNIVESLALRERKSFSEKYSCSSNYLEDLCMTSVNQTIGRVIRHKDDYAVIILLDSRYRNPKLKDRLATWMHPFIELQDQFGSSIERVSTFFKKFDELSL
jgi:chromosome transmission fidelity protein 1